MAETRDPQAKANGQPSPAEKDHASNPTSSIKGFLRELLIGITSHSFVYYIAPIVLASAPAIWLYVVAGTNIPQWSFLVFVILTIVLVYLALISLQYFFQGDFNLSRRISLHLALIALVVVTVTAPLALLLSYLRLNENRLMRIYNQVTPQLSSILQTGRIDSEDFKDLQNSCITSIHLSKPQQYELRITVLYLDESGNYLVMPDGGYEGPGFNKDMKYLYFDVSQRPRLQCESVEEFENRIGVAGRSYLDGKSIRDDDVQIPKSRYRYKPYAGSSSDQPDRSMMCIPIPDLRQGHIGNIGVLSISSPSRHVFSENDEVVGRFYATLLSKYSTPLKTPSWLLNEVARKNCVKPIPSPGNSSH